MPIFFLLIGILLIVVGINNKMGELGALIKEDFVPQNTKQPGFPAWIIAVFAIGSLGYVKSMKPVANSFLVLVVVSMVLANRGFFDNFSQAFKRTSQ